LLSWAQLVIMNRTTIIIITNKKTGKWKHNKPIYLKVHKTSVARKEEKMKLKKIKDSEHL